MITTKKIKNSTRAVSTRRTSPKQSASLNSINNGIKVVGLAIRKGISVSAASIASGHGKNYIADIKERLEENYKSRNITRELYRSFSGLIKEYNKTMR